MSLLSEIFSQPDVLSRLLENTDDISCVADEIRKRKVSFVYIAARGTSDNAGLYAKYLWGTANRLPIAQAAPSQFSIYKTPPLLNDSLVVGISQSGQSPDIISVLEEGKKQGVLTLGITNDGTSPLAKIADLVIDIGAGEEKAVAATKTYTAELLIVAVLSALLDKDSDRFMDLKNVPVWVSECLKQESRIERIVERYRYIKQ